MVHMISQKLHSTREGSRKLHNLDNYDTCITTTPASPIPQEHSVLYEG